jgi:hypothetical protein
MPSGSLRASDHLISAGRVWLVSLAGMLLLGCGEQSPQPPRPTVIDPAGAKPSARTADPIASLARFQDATKTSGVDFTYRDGQEAGHFSILESLGGGVALFDYDGDGALDVFVPGGGSFDSSQQMLGRPGALFHNEGRLIFENVTVPAGVDLAPHYSHGAAVGDFDGDGFSDLLVTGYGGLALFCNRGDGTFSEGAADAGLTDTLWSSSAAWGDLNGDGVLDLYVAHYVDWSFSNHPFCPAATDTTGKRRDVCPPKSFTGLPHTLYFGSGDGTFRDGSREAGLEPAGTTLGKGLGVLLADVDLDGDLDIYVANDTVPKFLYRNQGTGTFEEVATQSGVAGSENSTPEGSMGIDMADYNLDGLPDLWVANYERESLALYRNDGECTFLHVSRAVGVAAVGMQFVSFGTVFFDFDRDGDEDVFVSNGHVIRYPVNSPLKQLPLLFENRGGRFVNVAPAAGASLQEPHLGRGVAAGDLDDDGDVDLVLSPINEPTIVLANESPNDNRWISVRLIGTRSHRDAVGARLTLTTSAGQQTRQIKGGGSYLSHSDQRPFFGIPREARIEKLTVKWPAGAAQVLTEIEPDKMITIIEP